MCNNNGQELWNMSSKSAGTMTAIKVDIVSDTSDACIVDNLTPKVIPEHTSGLYQCPQSVTRVLVLIKLLQ